ncbi:MAG: hypothetical protein V3S70_07265 [Gammaproteobacteria bacterium]
MVGYRKATFDRIIPLLKDGQTNSEIYAFGNLARHRPVRPGVELEERLAGR